VKIEIELGSNDRCKEAIQWLSDHGLNRETEFPGFLCVDEFSAWTRPWYAPGKSGYFLCLEFNDKVDQKIVTEFTMRFV